MNKTAVTVTIGTDFAWKNPVGVIIASERVLLQTEAEAEIRSTT